MNFGSDVVDLPIRFIKTTSFSRKSQTYPESQHNKCQTGYCLDTLLNGTSPQDATILLRFVLTGPPDDHSNLSQRCGRPSTINANLWSLETRHTRKMRADKRMLHDFIGFGTHDPVGPKIPTGK
ncbi:hypothetical protein TcasGA2_TC008313 [Tribolium castaneum]|uniref:Uncharacterized protein n=1 Tax=Tribolium castaneum TaxID=7070 RepID=D2A122_TRICA|nr:hypothetical protein TcasGA2_TC008313 [Tribolium castaneum]